MDPLPIEPNVVIDGYDLTAEKARYRFPDVTIGSRTLNRGTAKAEVTGAEDDGHAGARAEHASQMFVTTHDAGSPVIELGHPVAGPYVSSSAGVYLDLMLGCAQKIVDENHPFFRDAVRHLFQQGMLLRREINTDDYITAEAAEGVHGPQELAALLNRAARARFVSVKGWRSFFCNSGTEAVEAAIKLCCLVRWRRLLQRVGAPTIEKVMADLGIERVAFDREPDGEEVWADYPMFLVATDGAFHGRTLGSLGLTRSKRAHQIGYPKSRWVRHVAYNGGPDALEAILDSRPLAEILEADGGVAKVIADGKIPTDLCAGFVAEGFQGEGGYVPGERAFFEGVAATCRREGILFVADEVQSMGRTGKLFSIEHLNVAPDVIAMAKASFLGICLARADFEAYLHAGWHSNTWGGGKIFDVNMAYATFDALLNYEDAIFDGNGYLENIAIKGEYLRRLLEKVRERHPDTLKDVRGRGGMIAISVKRRDEVLETAWRHGLKMLGCGPDDEVGSIRLLLMADTLTKEVEEIAVKIDEVLTVVEAG